MIPRPLAEFGVIVESRQISMVTWEQTLRAPRIAAVAQSGQFVHVRASSGFIPFLRRPLSVGPVAGDEINLIFSVRGEGTRLLSELRPGAKVDLIGPLGNPYKSPSAGSLAVLVAGGIGIVPLLLLDSQFPNMQTRAFFLGVRSRDHMSVSRSEIDKRKIIIATDDGSDGFHGNIIQLLDSRFNDFDRKQPYVYGCGPTAMLAGLKRFCGARGLPLQVSLEVPMGCGVGACQSCAVPLADGTGYRLVCRDGPVFDANEIDLRPELAP